MSGHAGGSVGLLLAILLALPATGAACELPPRQDASRPLTVFHIDPTKSLVRFDAQAFLHSFGGTTQRVEGIIRLGDLNGLSDAEACVRIDARSLTTGNATRDGIMRADHLETAKYPAIAFRLLAVEDVHRQPQGWDFAARGILILHGVARQVALPIQAQPEGGAVRLRGRLPLRMSDYGIPIPRFLLLTVEDQVVVSFDVLARLAAE